MTWSVGAGLEGKAVIVTGAAGGIGSAIARAFVTAGAHVLAVDARADALATLVASLDGEGHHGIPADLTNVAEMTSVIEAAQVRLGHVDVFVHAAAVLIRRSSLRDVTEEDWDTQLDINLKATFFLSRAAGEVMVEQGTGGRIILFSSQAWWTGGFGGSVVYSASKAGVVGLARGLARTYGPHGITVNTVAPGQVNTPMLHAGLSRAMYERMKADTPLGYVADPEELAGPVVFLASSHASFISAATLNVSGGFLAY